MSQRSPPNTPGPSETKRALSFIAGLLLGLAIVVPAVPNPPDLVQLARGTGEIGRVLVAGIVVLALVTAGTVALYRVFAMVDR